MTTIAQAKAQLADPNAPASPLELIPDAATRAKETTRQTFERIAPHLSVEIRQRLRSLSQEARYHVVKRIIEAERRKEMLATAHPTPSPKQRRALAREEEVRDGSL